MEINTCILPTYLLNYPTMDLLRRRLDLYIRVESGSDDPVYLGHFLVGQVGLILELNYLDVTRIFNTSHVLWKKHWHLRSECNLGLVNALNLHHWYETSLLPYAVLKHVLSRDFIPKNSVHGTSSVS